MKKTTSGFTHQKSARFSGGFTIVELLIVIVVIGILAAITIVAYNGIQARAENGKTIAGVNQAIKLLSIYREINGDYPNTGGQVCIGTGYPSGVCSTANDGTTPTVRNSSTLDSALASVGSLPTMSAKALTMSSGIVVRGANYEYNAKMIRYHLDGAAASCSAGGTGYNNGSVTQCRLILP